jgi:hypothetical protein
VVKILTVLYNLPTGAVLVKKSHGRNRGSSKVRKCIVRTGFENFSSYS